MTDAGSVGERATPQKITVLPTAAPEPVRQRRSQCPEDLPTLMEARKRKEISTRPAPTIEIKLLSDGRISYDVPNLGPEDAYKALLGCYAVMGEMLDTLRRELLPAE
ncbi:hypothetical protein R20233_01452 [Ralstonia sp. LMG 32965]|uniref:hypothetical protein n=1 Tax=Ralstonia flatus TaxID=3058601 RepID=UPI0028F62AFC|nr:hypothetical protein [Ralstonia sp. LMG 32965]CAJ0867877.1 hypothetical protein R20233_01452 [Ralstonia sp. LMG 32965]